MTEKDPSLWGIVLAWLLEPSPALQGFLMALLIAVLRLIYDRKEKAWQRIALEGLLCGLLTVAGTSITALALSFWWPTFQAPVAQIAIGVGGTVGFFGVEAVRRAAIRLLGSQLRQVAPGDSEQQ
ncbi:phage holin, lambda family [Pseudomonas sp. LFM046]|uniref:phage holin, lambda family n=1 Tax=Pseudomonas sp. LFM046 TaxID=1608357 RepID=UPI0005CFAE8F|nr:phage holin, lambda family [Pseudomonas sp. LFM046]